MFSYAPHEVLVTVNGFPITGFGEDEFCTAEKNSDDGELTIGADGEGAVSRSRDESGTITITCGAQSAANDIMMAAYAAFKAIGAVSVVFVKDLNGRSLHMAERAFPKKLPPKKYGKKAGEVQWQWVTDKLVSNVGGSNLAPTVPAT